MVMRGFLSFVFSKLFLCILLIAAYAGGIILLCLWLPALFSLGTAVLALFLFSACAAACAALGDYPAEFRCLWLLVIAALPAVGAAAYFITRSRGERGNAPTTEDAKADCSAEYFADGRDFFAALYAAVEGAQKSVHLEFYIIAKGRVFDGLRQRLEDALRRGVEVKIVTDALGSALRLPSSGLRRLKRAGAQIKIFNRLVPPPLSRLNFRDHRKIAVIDGTVAFSGGMNVADEYAGYTRPHGHWKDSAFCVRGNGAACLERLFLAMWPGHAAVPLPPHGEGEQTMEPVHDSPPAQCGRASGALVQKISAAHRRIWVFTPYLCPDERVFAAICERAKSGVDVKILVPAIPDKRTAYAVTCDCAARLRGHGAAVYKYTPGFMHAKAVICDDIVFLGSYNLDCRSLWLNYECGAFFKGEIVEDAARDFENCLALSSPLYGRKRKLARLVSPLA